MDLLYGSRDLDLEVVAHRLAADLGVGEAHESLYLGGDYYIWRVDQTEVRLQHNRELEEELAEPMCSDCRLILRVEAAESARSWDEVARRAGFTRLITTDHRGDIHQR